MRILRIKTKEEIALIKRVEEAENIAAAELADNMLLRAQLVSLVTGKSWRMVAARWLIARERATYKVL